MARCELVLCSWTARMVLGQHVWLLLTWASRVALSSGQLVDFIRGGSAAYEILLL
jgi:hypothetical protein